jgi:hypothetical protein
VTVSKKFGGAGGSGGCPFRWTFSISNTHLDRTHVVIRASGDVLLCVMPHPVLPPGERGDERSLE